MFAAKMQERSHARRVEEDIPFKRFEVSQRVEHLLLMISFTGLVITGLPQKFYSEEWAAGIILLLGGVEFTRMLHRFLAALFVLESLYHSIYIAVGVLRGRQAPSMIPSLQDVRDAFTMLRFCLGVSNRRPKFDRFDYRQKFEYWGVVLGALIMIVTGLILWFPTYATYILPGELVPAAKEMHGGEALLAFLVIVVWHLYSVHLSPVQFPGDTSIFTGKLSTRKMIHEHPLEYARVKGVPIVDEEESSEFVVSAERDEGR